MRIIALVFVVAIGNVRAAAGQEQSRSQAPVSRIEQIQADVELKSSDLKPHTPGPIEKRFVRAENVVRGVFQRGRVHVRLGGLPQGAGLAFGPAFKWAKPDDTVRLDVSAVASFKSFYSTRAAMMFPDIIRDSLHLEIEAAHLDAPRLEYYGRGPDSVKVGLTNFRKEDTHLEVRFSWKPAGRLSTGVQTGALFVNIGPGTASSSPSTDSVYGPAEAAGIDVQSNFLVLGYVVDFDSRDYAGDPHHGTHASLRYRHYADLKRDRYSFDQFSASAEHYVPFFNEKRVIALRARTDLSYRSRDQAVPFFLQPTLGGATDLRGFGLYRFHDDNLILFNAEYRWEVDTGITAAVFGDAGRVFAKPGQISLSHLETAAGFGVRFKTRNKVVVRIDNGISREGYQLWLKFNNVF
jgi:hypothetical protein